MKTASLLIALVVVLLGYTHLTIAQIPNAGFETWSAGEPASWGTSNQGLVNITSTSASHSGALAAHGAVVDAGGGFPWIPVLMAGTKGEGFPVNTQHPALRGWYKLSPLSGDMLFITIAMLHADSAVGGGFFLMPTASSVYREFVANVMYLSPQAPDTCFIQISIEGSGGGLAHIGSTFDMDDLAFGPAVAADEHGNAVPATFRLSQNYPNPFNPTTRIEYDLPRVSQVHLGVYDMLGQEIAVLVNEQQTPGVYRADFTGENLPSGTYFYRLQAGDFTQVKKLLLVR